MRGIHMEEKLKDIEMQAVEQLRSVQDSGELDSIRVKYLGKKGALTELLRGMRDVPSDKRPLIGKLANQVKEAINAELDAATARLKEKELEAKAAAQVIDTAGPRGRRPDSGDQRRRVVDGRCNARAGARRGG